MINHSGKYILAVKCNRKNAVRRIIISNDDLGKIEDYYSYHKGCNNKARYAIYDRGWNLIKGDDLNV